MSADRDPFVSRSWSELRMGASLPIRALRLLRSRRELWPLAALPVALSALALIVATGFVASYFGELSAWLGTLLPQLEPSTWYSWLWVGPGKLLFALLRWLLFVLVAAAALVVALLCASLAASPVLDALSYRVECCVSGSRAEPLSGGFRELVADALSSLVNDARRLAFFAALWLAIWLPALLIPGGPVLAAPILALLTVLFLPLEYAAYALDRRRLSFAQRRAWLREHRALAVGFGGAAFAFGLVPGLNLLLLPALVTAGTLLVLDRPPPGAAAGEAGSGIG